MKPDDFENTLARIPLRPPPASWRDEILDNARAAASLHAEPPSPAALTPPRTLEAWFRRWITPWTGLATAAACSLLLNSAAQWIAPERGSTAPRSAEPPSPGFTETLRTHRSTVLALVNSEELDADTVSSTTPPNPPASSKPRSEIRLQPNGGWYAEPTHPRPA